MVLSGVPVPRVAETNNNNNNNNKPPTIRKYKVPYHSSTSYVTGSNVVAIWK